MVGALTMARAVADPSFRQLLDRSARRLAEGPADIHLDDASIHIV